MRHWRQLGWPVPVQRGGLQEVPSVPIKVLEHRDQAMRLFLRWADTPRHLLCTVRSLARSCRCTETRRRARRSDRRQSAVVPRSRLPREAGMHRNPREVELLPTACAGQERVCPQQARSRACRERIQAPRRSRVRPAIQVQGIDACGGEGMFGPKVLRSGRLTDLVRFKPAAEGSQVLEDESRSRRIERPSDSTRRRTAPFQQPGRRLRWQ